MKQLNLKMHSDNVKDRKLEVGHSSDALASISDFDSLLEVFTGRTNDEIFDSVTPEIPEHEVFDTITIDDSPSSDDPTVSFNGSSITDVSDQNSSDLQDFEDVELDQILEDESDEFSVEENTNSDGSLDGAVEGSSETDLNSVFSLLDKFFENHTYQAADKLVFQDGYFDDSRDRLIGVYIDSIALGMNLYEYFKMRVKDARMLADLLDGKEVPNEKFDQIKKFLAPVHAYLKDKTKLLPLEDRVIDMPALGFDSHVDELINLYLQLGKEGYINERPDLKSRVDLVNNQLQLINYSMLSDAVKEKLRPKLHYYVDFISDDGDK